MNTALLDVAEFHEKMRQTIGDPRFPCVDIDTQLRWELIREEFEELTQALQAKDKHGNDLDKKAQVVAVADALGDMCYVIAGAAVTWGIDLGGVFDAIHASNMTKSYSNKRQDGKILKGKNYQAPDIQGALDNAKAECETYGFGQDAWWPQPTVIHPELPVVEPSPVSQELKAMAAMKTIKADYLPQEVWTEPAENTSFGDNQMPAAMTPQFRSTDTVMGVPLNEAPERDTDPTILYSGQFLNRGAFVFDCPCNRTHEIPLKLGSRGGRAKEGQVTCFCGKIFKVAFSFQNGEDHAEFVVEDLGGHS